MKSRFRMNSSRLVLAVVTLPFAWTLGVSPALSQGRRFDDPHCQSLAAEALKPLPPPPTAPVLEPPPKDSGPEGLAALNQMAAAIAAIRGGLAAQKGYWQGTAEGNRERRDRAFADWRARNQVIITNYSFQREAWAAEADRTRFLLNRLERECLAQQRQAPPPRPERVPDAAGKVETRAAGCWDDTIRTVASSGEVIVMQSGSVFEVLPGDNIDAALWLPITSVTICERTITVKGKLVVYYDIINHDDREKVGAIKMK